MNKDAEIKACLNCKFAVCRGAADCPALSLGKPKKSIKVSTLLDLLRAGYDPAEICFAVVEGGLPT